MKGISAEIVQLLEIRAVAEVEVAAIELALNVGKMVIYREIVLKLQDLLRNLHQALTLTSLSKDQTLVLLLEDGETLGLDQAMQAGVRRPKSLMAQILGVMLL